jgi:hypothetical protein
MIDWNHMLAHVSYFLLGVLLTLITLWRIGKNNNDGDGFVG